MDDESNINPKANDLMITLQNEKSAMLGFWRMGATWEEISEIMDLPAGQVKQIVLNYLNEKE